MKNTPMTAAEFSAAVTEAAARAGADATFGPRKVFIAAIAREPAFRGMAVTEFKARLLAAHRAGALVLCRADLVGAMDPALVRDSEATDGISTYHFVERHAVVI